MRFSEPLTLGQAVACVICTQVTCTALLLMVLHDLNVKYHHVRAAIRAVFDPYADSKQSKKGSAH